MECSPLPAQHLLKAKSTALSCPITLTALAYFHPLTCHLERTGLINFSKQGSVKPNRLQYLLVHTLAMACHRLLCLPSPARTRSRYFLSVRQLWVPVAVRQHAASTSKQLQARALSVISETSPSSSRVQAGNGQGGLGNVIDILERRGLIEATTGEGLRAACSRPETAPLKVYVGFDPTAESLHLGHLLGIIVLSWFQRCGHVPVAVVGGATGRVGDPSGKRTERPVLDEETILRNCKGIQETISRLLGGNGHSAQAPGAGLPTPMLLNNYDWWKDMTVIAFLRDVGRYARLGTMLAKESVRSRLQSEVGMSYTEFTYQLIQGYDFVHLFREMGVSVQAGGSDQWGNITAGTDLIRRILKQDGAYGLTHPLLLKSDGTKIGKSEGGAIWLTPSFLSPDLFYQYLLATQDSDVIKFLKMLTFLSLDEIAHIEESMGRPDYLPNSAQRRLAEEVTRFVHGDKGLEEAINATRAPAVGELESVAL